MDKKSSIERNERINAAIVQVFLILISITMLVPFIWMILGAVFVHVVSCAQPNYISDYEIGRASCRERV